MQVRSNGVFLEYDTFGEPSGKPILLISGLNTPMTRWTSVFCEKLVSCGFYVIRYDNRDCGLSTHFDDAEAPSYFGLLMSRFLGIRLKPPYVLMDMVQDAVGLLDALGIDSAHIVGRSMGGMIAQALVASHPKRVASLTIIMSSTGNPKLPLPRWEVMKHMIAKSPSPFSDLAGYLRHRVAYTKSICSMRYPLNDFFIRSRVLDDIKRAGFHPGAARRQFAALLQAGDIRAISSKIKVPTIVIHGDMDPLVPLACGVDVHQNISGSRFKVVDDMGHSLQPEFYDEIVGEIRKHLT